MNTVIQVDGDPYVSIEAVEKALQAGTLSKLLADAKASLVVETPEAKTPVRVARSTRLANIYEFPREFQLGVVITLQMPTVTRKGRVSQIIVDRKAVTAIVWGGKDHTVVSDFLRNMTDLDAVYDGLSTFVVY